MTRYWVVRTDKAATDWIWTELQAGRLRQGWGYQDDQDLALISSLLRAGAELSSAQRDTWRGNRRLLQTEPDSAQLGDLALLPHLPTHGTWSLARVVGPYSWTGPTHPNAWTSPDYGHVLPVELVSQRPIHPLEDAVSARLRQSMRVLSRMWNIDGFAADVEELAEAVSVPGVEAPPPALDRLPRVLSAVEAAAWESLQKQFHGAEFERPCVLLLEALYGDENVEHTGGAGERGADAICTYTDPLGVVHRLAVQIKMWEGRADWTRPLEQVRQAYLAYDGITAGVILSTSEEVGPSFDERRQELEAELHIPIRVILRRELVRLFIAHLPELVER